MKLRILEHYHGDLSGKRHLQAGEEYEVPGEVLTMEAAEALAERGKAYLVVEAATEPEVEADPAEQPVLSEAEGPEGVTGETETAAELTKAAQASVALVATMTERRKKNK